MSSTLVTETGRQQVALTINTSARNWILFFAATACSSYSATTVINTNDAGVGNFGTSSGGGGTGSISSTGGMTTQVGGSASGGTSNASDSTTTGGSGTQLAPGGAPSSNAGSGALSTSATGGILGTGGVNPTGGVLGTGGTIVSGGSTGSGGITTTGGVPSTGGTSTNGTGTSTLKPLGAACTASGQCSNNLCVDGVCCESNCAGACKQCTAGTGKCDTTPPTDVACGTVTCPANTTCLSYVAPVAGECNHWALAPQLRIAACHQPLVPLNAAQVHFVTGRATARIWRPAFVTRIVALACGAASSPTTASFKTSNARGNAQLHF